MIGCYDGVACTYGVGAERKDRNRRRIYGHLTDDAGVSAAVAELHAYIINAGFQVLMADSSLAARHDQGVGTIFKIHDDLGGPAGIIDEIGRERSTAE